jgi:hypothetical protein
VFLDDLLEMPSERAMKFKIKLQPGIGLRAKSPYWMMPVELTELKIQLKDLLDKCYICLNLLPWGCSTLCYEEER